MVPVSVSRASGEYDRAHQVFKQYKVGMRGFDELTLEEIGLLAVYFTWMFRCEECGCR